MQRKPESSAATFPVDNDRLPKRSLREGRYEMRFAQNHEELDAILRLRFEVFNLDNGQCDLFVNVEGCRGMAPTPAPTTFGDN